MRPDPTEHGELLKRGFKEVSSKLGLWVKDQAPGISLFVDFRSTSKKWMRIPNIYVKAHGDFENNPDPGIYPDLAPFVPQKAPERPQDKQPGPPQGATVPPAPSQATAGEKPGGASPIHPQPQQGAPLSDPPPRDLLVSAIVALIAEKVEAELARRRP